MFSTGTTSCGWIWININWYWFYLVYDGDITIKVGDGNTLDGGHVSVFAGKTDAGGTTGATGGSISIRSGFSTESSSGSIIIRTLNAGAKKVFLVN